MKFVVLLFVLSFLVTSVRSEEVNMCLYVNMTGACVDNFILSLDGTTTVDTKHINGSNICELLDYACMVEVTRKRDPLYVLKDENFNRFCQESVIKLDNIAYDYGINLGENESVMIFSDMVYVCNPSGFSNRIMELKGSQFIVRTPYWKYKQSQIDDYNRKMEEIRIAEVKAREEKARREAQVYSSRLAKARAEGRYCCRIDISKLRDLVQGKPDNCFCYLVNEELYGMYRPLGSVFDFGSYVIDLNKYLSPAGTVKGVFPDSKGCVAGLGEVDLREKISVDEEIVMNSGIFKFMVSHDAQEKITQACRTGFLKLGPFMRTCDFVLRTCDEVVDLPGFYQVPWNEDDKFVSVSNMQDIMALYKEGENIRLKMDLQLYRQIEGVAGSVKAYFMIKPDQPKVSKGTEISVFESDGSLFSANGAIVLYRGIRFFLTSKHLNLPEYGNVTVGEHKPLCGRRIPAEREKWDVDIAVYKLGKGAMPYLEWSDLDFDKPVRKAGTDKLGDVTRVYMGTPYGMAYKTTFTDFIGGDSGVPMLQDGKIVGMITGSTTSWVVFRHGYVTLLTPWLMGDIADAVNSMSEEINDTKCFKTQGVVSSTIGYINPMNMF